MSIHWETPRHSNEADLPSNPGPSAEAKPKPKRLTKTNDTQVQSTVAWGGCQFTIGPTAVPESKSKLKRPPEKVSLELKSLEDNDLSNDDDDDDDDDRKLPVLLKRRVSVCYDTDSDGEEVAHHIVVQHRKLNDLIDRIMLFMTCVKDEAPIHGTKVLRLDWVDH